MGFLNGKKKLSETITGICVIHGKETSVKLPVWMHMKSC